MVFSSLLFLFRFLPVMILVYFAAPGRLRNGVLFIGSLVFYGWGEPVYMSLLLFSTAVDFVHGKLIRRFRQSGKERAAKWAVASSVAVNLGLLGFFKYAGFLVDSANALLGTSIPFKELALPVGISFYTFQTMSYTIDVYRGTAEVQDDIVAFGAYVSMFPQLIAGPIVRYHTIAGQLKKRAESYGQFAGGVRIFVSGLGKKVLIANQAGAVWTEVLGVPGADRTVLMAWLGILAFGLQIYFDFSGYSDMAVGLGRMFGFSFPENFKYPYRAESVTDFWRRWHVSLGAWFKEYVYIPLGGSRNGKAAQVRNILIVWLLTGVWHGAGWNFVLWGLYFGVLLLAEKLVFHKLLERLPGAVKCAATLLLVLFSWVLFAHDSLREGLLYFGQMFGGGGMAFSDGRTLYLLSTNLALLTAAAVGSGPAPKRLYDKVIKGLRSRLEPAADILEAAGILAVLALSTACLVDAGYNPFLYFRF